ncbi:MAG: HNH endonuclease [Hyphomonadaceae bacterium]
MVSTTTRCIVWARGAGRCSYCNKSLIGDLAANNEDSNFGFVAHIVGEKPTSPRGHPTRSAELADDPNNLMLMCYPHHKLIDVDEVDQYPEERLLSIKEAHESRIAILADIAADRASHVLRYGAKIGDLESPLSFGRVRTAMTPEFYPAEGRSIGIEILGSVARDSDATYWDTEARNLEHQFNTHVRSRLASREVTHLSVFALAPIPLLVKLGALLGDIVPARIHQLHREPPGWRWAENGDLCKLSVRRPQQAGPKVALKLEVSAPIVDGRVTDVLGSDVAIWSIATERPHNDVMRFERDLQAFRELVRPLLDEIKVFHGEETEVHVFAAVPVSVAVELGRVRMPKAHPRFIVYDNVKGEGFVRRLVVD